MGKKKAKPEGVVEIGLFHAQVAVFQDVIACDEYLTKLGCECDWPNHTSLAVMRYDTDGDGVLRWSIVITEEANDGTVVHECVHCADFIMDKYGIPTGAENTEIRAYLTAEIYGGVKEILSWRKEAGK